MIIYACYLRTFRVFCSSSVRSSLWSYLSQKLLKPLEQHAHSIILSQRYVHTRRILNFPNINSSYRRQEVPFANSQRTLEFHKYHIVFILRMEVWKLPCRQNYKSIQAIHHIISIYHFISYALRNFPWLCPFNIFPRIW